MFEALTVANFWKYIILLVESLLVVVLAIIFYLLQNYTPFKKVRWIYRQLIIGIVFGGAAIFGTEMGVDIGSSIINVRDAAPLVAGLVFGGPAGMIAAIIGSVERLVSTYVFYKGAYSVVACVVATFLAGGYAWILRKYFFESKTPSWLFGFATAAIMEVIHFIVLYITNIKDPQTVLNIIMDIAIPMILGNGVGVALSCLAVGLLEDEYTYKKIAKRRKSIHSKIQVGLLLLILVTATMSTSFVMIIQNNYANETAEEALDKGIEDSNDYILNFSNELAHSHALSSYWAYTDYAKKYDNPNDILIMLRDCTDQRKYQSFGFTTASIIAYDTEDGHEEGQILYSSNTQLLGANILETSDARLQGLHELVKAPYGDIDHEDPMLNVRHTEAEIYESKFYGERVKIANISLVDDESHKVNMNAYLQLVFDSDAVYDINNYMDNINSRLAIFTQNRRVYLNGYVVIIDKNDTIVSHTPMEKIYTEFELSRKDIEEIEPWKMEREIIYNEDSYYMHVDVEDYIILSIIPTTDVTEGRNMMIIVYSFMLTVIYASIFFVSYILIKNLIIRNIRKINDTLALIIKGDLDQKVEVNSSSEFEDLSNDINYTVDTLKRYIKEADERIDKELAFARVIQSSSLPSVFPPFPGITEFDIYATMNTAKEVGGDFYDFYFVDANRLAFLVADVSGKGIPASMFMMESKALLKNSVLSLKEVDKVFSRVNDALSQGNEANMFVTCWMGIIDLATGEVQFANAGHNAPLIYEKKTGKWKYIEQNKDLVLAGLEGVPYHAQSIKLHPGDKIFLYTDGVVEATRGDKVLYGEERLLKFLNKSTKLDQYKLLASLQKDIDNFIDGAPQFDDITMLYFDFKNKRKVNE